ncbi:hypothetical protein [Psychroserpens sp. NJDZ02]|uniref:hypothetical protein n=1 Tax=Psychroserpens sp. NJDZ02 TaxID=2570561 RepID=UPI0014562BCE|nr:hypothetical protein [Psychroserpens sp. NJDZ02]
MVLINYSQTLEGSELGVLETKFEDTRTQAQNRIQLGVETGQAYAWSRTRMGGWAVAQSPILKTTITTSRLKTKRV